MLNTGGGSAGLTQPPAVSGLGGIGKTEIAKEFAHRWASSYELVFWMTADSKSAVMSGFRLLGKQVGVVGSDETVPDEVVRHQVKQWLNDHDQYLLVYDNADDLNLIMDWLPDNRTGRRHVLLTTRASSTRKVATKIEVEKLPPESGAWVLLRCAEKIGPEVTLETAALRPDWEDAKAVSIALDGLPLALDQAGAYLAEKELTPADYLRHFEKRKAKLLKERGTITKDHPLSVWVTFTDAFTAIKEQSEAAGELVVLCAFLAPDNIPDAIFRDGAEYLGDILGPVAADEVEFAEAYGVACRFSLLRRNADRTFTIHRLVQEVIQAGLPPEEQKTWAERAVNAVALAFPKADFENWDTCEHLWPQVESAKALVKTCRFDFPNVVLLLNRMGDYLYFRSARYVETESLLLETLEIYQKGLPAGHPYIATSLNNLALVYQSQGRSGEAEPLYLEALEMRRKGLPAGHPDIANNLNNLGTLYKSQGRYGEAKPLYQEALEIDRKGLPSGHPSIATDLNNLAGFYESQGRYGEAEPLYLEALEIYRKGLPAGHPLIATNLNNLAALYDSQGRYGEAEPLYLEALEIRQKSLPAGHPDIASSLNNLATLYYKQGRCVEAEPLYLEALEMRRKGLPASHPDIATSLNNLALLYHSQGQYAKAKPLYLEALEIRQKGLPAGHPDIASSINNLAGLHDSQGKYEEAEPLYEEAVAIWQKSLGTSHPTTLIGMRNYACLLRALGRDAEAETLETEIRATQESP
ncbi:MAG: tetratricopeptide repeat protein [Acidobacteria bacterium]|nr:tetratricopeptide repeat protein [Acidobacteriota bacterium]